MIFKAYSLIKGHWALWEYGKLRLEPEETLNPKP